MPQPSTEKWIPRFIECLKRVRKDNDRATLASLRRGFTDHPAERDAWVFSHLSGASPRHEETALLIASLFALHPQDGGKGSLGEAFSQMRTDRNAESLGKRFASLLDSHADELPARLRQAVSLLKANNAPVDWQRLLEDRLNWEKPRRAVQRCWARDYWANGGVGEPVEIPASKSLSTNNEGE